LFVIRQHRDEFSSNLAKNDILTGNPVADARVSSCTGCHQRRKDRFGSFRKPANVRRAT
jgi:hypothetical protein